VTEIELATLIERLRELAHFNNQRGWTNGLYAVEAADKLEALSGRMSELETAVEQAAEWFEDYARQHRATAEALRQPGDVQPSREPEAKGRDQKAVTNELRAKSMRAALAQTQSEG
jgi:hypothetical protein